MLCPKCDYISFDHHTNCTKCNHDLAEIASLLNGTSVSCVQVNYLGIGDEIPAGDDAANIFAADTELAVEEGRGLDADYSDSFAEKDDVVEMSEEEVSDTLERALEDLSGDDSAVSGTKGDEPDLLEVTLDDDSSALESVAEESLAEYDATGLELEVEGRDTGKNSDSGIEFTMPPVLDLEGIQTSESDAESNREASLDDVGDELESEAADSAGIELSEVGDVEEQQTPLAALHLESASEADDEGEEDQPQALALDDEQIDDFTASGSGHSADLGIDESALTLEVDDDDQDSGLTFEGDQDGEGGAEIEAAGATGIDLGNIDLSDLVYALDPDSQEDLEAVGDKPAAADVIKSSVPDDELSLKLESDIEPETSAAEKEPDGQDTDENDALGSLGTLSLESDDDTSDLDDRPLDFAGGADNLVEASAEDDAFDSLDMSVDSADDDGMELDLEIDDDK